MRCECFAQHFTCEDPSDRLIHQVRLQGVFSVLQIASGDLSCRSVANASIPTGSLCKTGNHNLTHFRRQPIKTVSLSSLRHCLLSDTKYINTHSLSFSSKQTTTTFLATKLPNSLSTTPFKLFKLPNNPISSPRWSSQQRAAVAPTSAFAPRKPPAPVASSPP
jgi:hypothetical protein